MAKDSDDALEIFTNFKSTKMLILADTRRVIISEPELLNKLDYINTYFNGQVDAVTVSIDNLYNSIKLAIDDNASK